ncbi:hypothetical protein HAX54_046203 [Datura stramonium]|uniref:Uncharacterized protein n=1 Tax=Datura stramonium TaxID=4076 RepID=A0ABS8WGL6_DATST|nr:hypothetical protein [Datura stramonium]
MRGRPPMHKIEKGPRSPDPAEKREQLQLEVPLEWNGCCMSRWCSSLSGFIIGAIESAVKGISPRISDESSIAASLLQIGSSLDKADGSSACQWAVNLGVT